MRQARLFLAHDVRNLLQNLLFWRLGGCQCVAPVRQPVLRSLTCALGETFRMRDICHFQAAGAPTRRLWRLKCATEGLGSQNHLLESSWRLTELSWRLLESLGGVLGSLTGVLGGAGTLAWFLAARCLFNINFQSTYKPLQHHFQSISNRSAHSAVPGQR